MRQLQIEETAHELSVAEHSPSRASGRTDAVTGAEPAAAGHHFLTPCPLCISSANPNLSQQFNAIPDCNEIKKAHFLREVNAGANSRYWEAGLKGQPHANGHSSAIGHTLRACWYLSINLLTDRAKFEGRRIPPENRSSYNSKISRIPLYCDLYLPG
ncbi:MAG: hypothetical protein KJZ64_04850 [Sphingomonadaceae bacterium]|nr:hypothetical protein [Sphingomonadaceae bacterium]